MERVETCNSVWLLDSALMRFCRMPKGVDLSDAVSAPWQRYYSWHDDRETGAFRVALDQARTRWLSSSRHLHPCPRCEGEPTTEVVMPAPPCTLVGDVLQ
jgi:hypothetical protein